MDRFGVEAANKIGSYVYALIDPRIGSSSPDRIFYVGKGTLDRCFRHSREELTRDEIQGEEVKLSRIREIREVTHSPPPITIVAFGLSTEEALRIEALLIALLTNLTNAVRGHNSDIFWLSAHEVNSLLERPIRTSEITFPILLVSLNGGSSPPYPVIASNPDLLKQRTLGNWAVGPQRAKKVSYVLGIYKQLVRCVYKVRTGPDGSACFEIISPERDNGKRRVKFEGERDDEKESAWGLRSIVDVQEVIVTKFGRQQATRYLGPL